MSVDTYLKRKNMSRYHRMRSGDLELLIAPILAQQARTIAIDARRRLL